MAALEYLSTTRVKDLPWANPLSRIPWSKTPPSMFTSNALSRLLDLQGARTLPSLTVENYVKSIFNISLTEESHRAATGQLANALNVSPGTVTSMLKTLSEAGLATYTPYEGVRLTDSGNELALRILRRHRLIELFLAQALDLEWDEVHEDAEHLEHVISDFLVDRIDTYLGHPLFDPHGDPIPTADGRLATRETESLVDCQPGTRFRLARVMDQSPEFLRYLRQSGFSLGAEGRVVANQPEAGTVTIELDNREITLGREAAQKLQVTTGRVEPRPTAVSVPAATSTPQPTSGVG
jgi:DtxR family Mn-dependent transcriptional regulator